MLYWILLYLIPLYLIPNSCYTWFRYAWFHYITFQIGHFRVMPNSCFMLYPFLLYPFLLYPIPALLYPILLYMIPLYQIPILTVIPNSVMTGSPEPCVAMSSLALVIIGTGGGLLTPNRRHSPAAAVASGRIIWQLGERPNAQTNRSAGFNFSVVWSVSKMKKNLSLKFFRWQRIWTCTQWIFLMVANSNEPILGNIIHKKTCNITLWPRKKISRFVNLGQRKVCFKINTYSLTSQLIQLQFLGPLPVNL